MRTLSAPFVDTLFDGASDEVIALLITIRHPDLEDGDIFLSSDNADLLDVERQLRGTISRGQAYAFLPMSLTLPEEGDDAGQTISITLDGVSREVTPLIRSTIRPASVTVEVVLASDPDQVEIELPFFELTSANVDASQVVLTLSVDAMSAEPYPADNFTPSSFGGLWSTT